MQILKIFKNSNGRLLKNYQNYYFNALTFKRQTIATFTEYKLRQKYFLEKETFGKVFSTLLLKTFQTKLIFPDFDQNWSFLTVTAGKYGYNRSLVFNAPLGVTKVVLKRTKV